MALTGLDIYKRLPKENCKECGVPTCLAFAMKVAGGQAGLDQCPRLSEASRAELGEASAPPQRLVKIGAGAHAIEIGQETVLFRHDEKLHHPTALALRVSDSWDKAALQSACAEFKRLQFTRVGQTLAPDMIALDNESGAPDAMATAAEMISRELGVPMVLMSPNADTLAAVAKGSLAGTSALLYCTSDVTADALAGLASASGSPVCVAGDIDAVAEKTGHLIEKGIRDIVLSPGPASASATLSFLTKSRRAALLKKFRPLGFPVLAMACGEDKVDAALDACAYVCKYAGVIVSDAWDPYLLLPILTARQNIYTDPQKPAQVEPKLHEVGDVTPESPLLVTTNFSLSYYSVESEVETSRIPCYILAVDTEGTSVLTAWAADKFNPETITAALKSNEAAGKVSHHRLIIPGHVAVITASLKDESGWDVMVGPKEAAGIGSFLKTEWRAA